MSKSYTEDDDNEAYEVEMNLDSPIDQNIRSRGPTCMRSLIAMQSFHESKQDSEAALDNGEASFLFDEIVKTKRWRIHVIFEEQWFSY